MRIMRSVSRHAQYAHQTRRARKANLEGRARGKGKPAPAAVCCGSSCPATWGPRCPTQTGVAGNLQKGKAGTGSRSARRRSRRGKRIPHAGHRRRAAVDCLAPVHSHRKPRHPRSQTLEGIHPTKQLPRTQSQQTLARCLVLAVMRQERVHTWLRPYTQTDDHCTHTYIHTTTHAYIHTYIQTHT